MDNEKRISMAKLTIREIADLAGVSTTTVSHILNDKGQRFSDETRQRVLKVVEENHFTPNYFASNIINNESKLIGIIVPLITEPFAATLINLIQKQLNQLGYHLMTSESANNVEEEIALFERYRQMAVEGIVCFTSTSFSKKMIVNSRYFGIPVVFVDRGINESIYGNVYFNEYETVFKAIELLIERGHRKIGLITDNNEQYSFPDRSQAYFDALKTNQIDIDDKRIVEAHFSVEEGYKATQKILEESDVTAIFCCDDNLALGCYQAVFDSGRQVNEDIKIVGFDGVEMLKNIRPQIKTLELPFKEFGYILSDKLIKAIERPLDKQSDDYLKMIFEESVTEE